MEGDFSEWRAKIAEASSRIYELAQQTPVALVEDDPRLGSARVFLKLEHLQKTGSFKLRRYQQNPESFARGGSPGCDYLIYGQPRIGRCNRCPILWNRHRGFRQLAGVLREIAPH